jgi:hypothetical protein
LEISAMRVREFIAAPASRKPGDGMPRPEGRHGRLGWQAFST